MCNVHLNLQICHGDPHAIMFHHHWLPGILAQGEGISPKSGAVPIRIWECRRSFQAKMCSVCGYTNHRNAPWRGKSDAQTCLGSHSVPSTEQQAKQCLATFCLHCSSKGFSPKGWCLPILPASPSSQPQQNSSGVLRHHLA